MTKEEVLEAILAKFTQAQLLKDSASHMRLHRETLVRDIRAQSSRPK